jgi:hypothetical protein
MVPTVHRYVTFFQSSNALLQVIELVMVSSVAGEPIGQEVIGDQVSLEEHHEERAEIPAAHLTWNTPEPNR